MKLEDQAVPEQGPLISKICNLLAEGWRARLRDLHSSASDTYVVEGVYPRKVSSVTVTYSVLLRRRGELFLCDEANLDHYELYVNKKTAKAMALSAFHKVLKADEGSAPVFTKPFVPMAIGMREQLHAHFPDVEPAIINEWLRRFAMSVPYLTSMVNSVGKPRVNLDGSPSDRVVTAEDAKSAMARLASRVNAQLRAN